MLTLGLPFVIAGALKSAYDVTLWRIFRRVPLAEAPRGAHIPVATATVVVES